MKDRIKERLGRILRIAGTILAAAVMAAVFYLAVVLGQPEAKDQPVTVDQPLLAASPAMQMTTADQLPQLTATFPVPVMSFLQGAGPELIAGASYDAAFENGFARVLELRYRLASGDTVTVQSIYPARALSLIKRDGYTLRTAASQSLAGLSAVRMDSPSAIRLYAQSAQALYVVTLPRMDAEGLSATVRALHLPASQ